MAGPRVISDEEMAKLEAAAPRVISDEEMERLETKKPYIETDPMLAPGAASPDESAPPQGITAKDRLDRQSQIIAALNWSGMGAPIAGVINSATGAGKRLALGLGSDVMGDYRRGRDNAAKTLDQAEDEHPLMRPLGTAIATGPLPYGKLGLLEQFLANGATAVGQSVASGKEDLTSGNADDYVNAAKRSGVALALSSVGTGVGAGIAKGLGKAASWFGGMAKNGEQAAADAAEALKSSQIKSAQGTASQKVAEGNRAWELQNAAASDETINPALRAQAAAFIASQEGAALREGVVSNALEAAPGKLAAINSTKQTLKDIIEKWSPAAVEAEKQATLNKHPLASAAWKLTKRLGPSALGGIGGYLTGGSTGAAEGIGAGTVMSAFMGQPGRIAINAAKSPAGKQFIGNAGNMLTGGAETAAQYGTSPATLAGTGLLDKYLGDNKEPELSPMPDDEREKRGSDNYKQKTGGGG